MSKHLQPITSTFFPTIFAKNQFGTKTVWPSKDTDLTNKVAVVTGANQGLGFETSDQLLALKLSRLVIAARSVPKGEAAAETLRAKYPKATIDVLQLDMLSYDSIQAFVTQLEHFERIDIVILNAGIRNLKFQLASTGHEETLQVNYISTALLAILLVPVLKRKSTEGPSRMTIVSSGLAFAAKFNEQTSTPLLPSFDNPKNFNNQDRYNTTKLLELMFLYKLADLVPAEDVVINAVDPGFVKGTNLTKGLPFPLNAIFTGFKNVAARPLNVGASTYVDAAAVKGNDSHGCYIMSWQISSFPPLLYTPEGEGVIERLWQETMTELSFASVTEILASLKKT